MVEPLKACSGDTVTWHRIQAAYPPSEGWTLTYYFNLAGVLQTVTAVDDGTGGGYLVTAALTSWAAGLWRWAARVSNGTEKHVIAEGILTVEPDPSDATDNRSDAEICLAAISAAIRAAELAGSLIVEYEIDGVKVKRDLEGARKARAVYQAKVRLQAGRPFFTRVPVRFP